MHFIEPSLFKHVPSCTKSLILKISFTKLKCSRSFCITYLLRDELIRLNENMK